MYPDACRDGRTARRPPPVAHYVATPCDHRYLFAPYSAFKVLRVHVGDGTMRRPHEVILEAAPDNLAEPEDLPLAPWS